MLLFFKKETYRIYSASIVVFLLSSFLFYSSTANAEDLTVFMSFNKEVSHIHNKNKDFGPGHKRQRSGDVSFELNSDVVGHFSMVGTVMEVDKKKNLDLRETIATTHLPEGTIVTAFNFKFPNKQDASHDNASKPFEGIIVGGTGNYKGIDGSFTSELSEDKSCLKTIFHINNKK